VNICLQGPGLRVSHAGACESRSNPHRALIVKEPALKKKPLAGGKTSVTFELPPEVEAETIVLFGEFNAWSAGTPLKKRKDGSFAVTQRLAPGRYRYRYQLDGSRWENDWAADDYAPNGLGSDDSILIL